MPDDTRQARRQRRRAILKAAEPLARRGLGALPSPAALSTLAAALRLDLDDPVAGARSAAARLLAVYDATLGADPPRDAVACRRGCSYCCHNAVAATAPEALLLAAHVRGRIERGELVRDDLAARLRSTAGKGRIERFGAKLPCALLGNALCSAYTARPLACRQVLSFLVEPCIEEFESIDGEFSVPAKPLHHASNCATALLAALLSAHRPTARLEMSAALMVALETPDAEGRWLAGEDVFASIAALEPWPAPLLTAARRIARDIVG
jgi:hypothetical protein